MTDEERKEFGAYLRRLRDKQGLSLRDVEAEVGVSSSYLYQIEKGDRNPPKVEVLRRLADTYKVSFRSMMAAAGLREIEEVDTYAEDAIERAYQYVINDPRFEFGTHMTTDELTTAGKRFIVEMYRKVTGGVDLLAELKRQEEADAKQ